MIKVTYLDHSGFLVELEDAYFLFDYYKTLDRKSLSLGFLGLLKNS